MAVGQGALNEFPGRFISDLGATMAAGSIVVGHRVYFPRPTPPLPLQDDWSPDHGFSPTADFAAVIRHVTAQGS